MKVGKKSIIYLLGVLIFIIYLFSADYIFNDLIKTNQEARLVDIKLPKQVEGIRSHIKMNQVKLKWKEALSISGWILKEGVKEKERDVFLVLESPQSTLMFDIERDTISRKDVSDHFNLGGDIHSHGFELTLIPYRLKEDSYQIGFVIKDSTGEYYHISNQILVRENGYWAVSDANILPHKKFISEGKSISVKASNASVRHYIDSFDVVGETITVSGWGFLDGLNTDDINHYILFKKGDGIEIFDIEGRNRADVTTHFKNSGLNLDSSGFFARIPAEKMKKGTYQIGLYLVKGETQGVAFVDKYIEINEDGGFRLFSSGIGSY